MPVYFFIIGMMYILIGFFSAILFYYIFRKRFLGNFWAALAVGVIGSVAGGFADHMFGSVFKYLSNLFNSMNLFPPLFISLFLVWLYHKLSTLRDE
jgi:uncharacterized membrane protein YeaQ/YmgE (transglycosylase-associated protein family)